MNAGRHVGLAKAAVWTVGAVLLTLWGCLGLARDTQLQPEASDRLVIDDFSIPAQKVSSAAKWEFVADRAAGGASAGRVQLAEHEGRTCLHLTGTIAAKSGSSLLQARRSLFVRRQPFDAHTYDGIQVTVKGNGETYAIHLRTRDTRYPAQYYEAEFQTSGQWQEIKLPFRSFVPAAVARSLDPAILVTLAIVAGQRELQADLYVDEIALYREQNMYRNLTPEEERVIVHRGTERPFSGKYNQDFDKGVYTCKRCGTELFESSSKFRSDCGWPSFDEQIPGRVKWQPDPDGKWTEIICNNCGAHLGHVFLGEHLTEKNTRYCVNSISMDFIPADQRSQQAQDNGPKTVGAGPRARPDESGQSQGRVPKRDESRLGVPVAPTDPQFATMSPSAPAGGGNPQSPERALFASGCFWGTQYYLQRAPGVISTTVGYTGGRVENPTYKQVCTGRTGHAETTEVLYDPSKIAYEQLAKLFFETHDFTQLNRQGPDIGPQYRSAIFYLNDQQKQIAERLVQQLRQKGFNVKTEITPAGKFWPAENYHQDYYNHTGKTPYCHVYRKIF